MTVRSRALIWAAIIITAAIVMNAIGLEGNASFGVVAGLSGAALGTIRTDAVGGRGCLQ